MKRSLLCAITAAVAMVGLAPSGARGQTAYYIAEFQVTDRETFRPYAARVESTFAPFSGRYIVQVRAWYNSPAYAEIRPIRQRSGHTNAYMVEGLPN